MTKDTEEYMGEEVYKIEEDASKEFAEEAAVHMKIGLTSHMSPVTLNIHNGLHSQTRQ